MSNLTKKTWQTITEKNIRPVPAWVMYAKNSAYWMGTVMLLLFSALATAVSFHAIFEIDWDAYAKADFSWYQTILSGVPIFSLFSLAIFLWMSIMLLHQTRRGYRYSFLLLAGIFFSSSMAFGYFIEGSPLDEPVEQVLLYALPHDSGARATLIPSAKRQWSQPERGLLGGSVLSSNATDITLRDASEALWTVDYTDAEVGENVSLEPEEEVKIIGEEDGEHSFKATEVHTWEKTSSQKSGENKKSQEKTRETSKQSERSAKEEKEDTDEGDKDDQDDEEQSSDKGEDGDDTEERDDDGDDDSDEDKDDDKDEDDEEDDEDD